MGAEYFYCDEDNVDDLMLTARIYNISPILWHSFVELSARGIFVCMCVCDMWYHYICVCMCVCVCVCVCVYI